MYLYQLRRANGIVGIFSKTPSLYRSERTFTYATYNNYEQNHAEVIRWHRQIKQAIYYRRNLPRNID